MKLLISLKNIIDQFNTKLLKVIVNEISKRVCIYISRLFCHVEVKIVIVGKASICFIENIGKLTLWYAVKKIELKKLRT